MVRNLFSLLIAVAVVPALSVADEPSLSRPRLVLATNASRILQRDNLMVRIVLFNPTAAELSVEPLDADLFMSYGRVQIRKGSTWELLNFVVDENFPMPFGGGGARTISSKAEFAEYSALHRHKKAFVFEEAGKYELRAIAKTSLGELTSNPVTIDVGDRTAIDLRRFEEAGKSLREFEFASLNRELTDNFTALERIGGNAAATIRAFLLTQEFAKSRRIGAEAVSVNRACDLLKSQMDQVCYENALNLLVSHYVARQDFDSLREIHRHMPYRSGPEREAARWLK